MINIFRNDIGIFRFFAPITLNWIPLAVAGGMAVVGAYSAHEEAKAQNKAMDVANENARRRYLLQSGIAEGQMVEQNQIAMQEMTDISRAYVKAKGTSKAVQAESMVGGVTAQRISANQRTKFSEAKSKVATNINTNITNIAQDMIANKIDTEAMIAEANSRRRNVKMDTLIAGIQGGASGYQLGTMIDGGSND